MNRRQITCVLLALLSTAQLAAPTTSDLAAREMARLQGSWRPVRLERKGEFVNDDFRPAARVVVHKDMMFFQVNDETLVRLRYRIEPGRTPKEINFTCTEGAARGEVLRGIYSLDDRRLLLCWPLEPASPRPALFLDAPDKDHATLSLERAE